jgi:hypothetical protein
MPTNSDYLKLLFRMYVTKEATYRFRTVSESQWSRKLTVCRKHLGGYSYPETDAYPTSSRVWRIWVPVVYLKLNVVTFWL